MDYYYRAVLTGGEVKYIKRTDLGVWLDSFSGRGREPSFPFMLVDTLEEATPNPDRYKGRRVLAGNLLDFLQQHNDYLYLEVINKYGDPTPLLDDEPERIVREEDLKVSPLAGFVSFYLKKGKEYENRLYLRGREPVGAPIRR